MSGFRAAVGLLTRVPARPGPETEKALPWLPIVGALIGATVAVIYVLLREAIAPLGAAGVAVGAGALLTGGLHEDGLADVADAFGADVTRERRLEILKDPQLGTFGVLALVVDVVTRMGAVAALDGAAALAALPAAHAASRAGPALLMWLLPTATPDGLGATYSRPVTARRALVAILAGTLIASGLLGFWALPSAAVVALVAAGMGLLSLRKIGGITGDVLGAAQQLTEIGVLLVCVAAAPSIPWWHS